MAKERDEAIQELRELLKPGDTVYCIKRHSTRSNSMHSVSPVVIRDNKPWEITHLVRPAVGWPFDQKHGGIKVSTSGACPISQLVNALGRKLYPDAESFPVLYSREL